MTCRLAVAAVVIGALLPTVARGQTSPTPPRVEIEAYGGLGRFFDAGAGALALPPAGAPITTSSPMAPSRRVSTWMFGDGTTLLNDVMAQLELTAQLTPLDPALATIGRRAERGRTVGGRLRVRTAPRVWAELAVDVTSRASDEDAGLTADVEATRSSFVDTFTTLLTSGPFTNISVTAQATPTAGAWRDVTTSLAANIELGSWKRVTPYATVGGGYVMRQGTAAAVSIEGRYRARILGGPAIDETDRVTIRGRANNAAAMIVGGGLAARGGRVSLRLDARAVLTNRTTSASVDATPLVATSTPADYIGSFTNPAIQFSNNPSTGRRSSLSGDALDRVDVTRSTRLQMRGLVTLGLAIRF